MSDPLRVRLDDEQLEQLADLVAARLAAGRLSNDVRHLTVAEAAERARCGQKTIRGAIHDGKLRAVQRAGRFLIASADLAAWLDPGTHAERPRMASGARSVRPRATPMADALRRET